MKDTGYSHPSLPHTTATECFTNSNMSPINESNFSTAEEITSEVLTDGMYFGESPRYHDGMLYVSDMTGRCIYTVDPSSGQKKTLLEVENQPNGMCFAADGSLIYSSMFDARLYRLSPNSQPELYVDMSHVMTGYCGDMVIDNAGRVYVDDVGARVLHGETPRAGRLLMIDTDRSVHVVAEDAVFPNALMLSNDGKSLIMAETFSHKLNKFDVALDGRLSNRQVIWTPPKIAPADVGHGLFSMDGGCMDAEDGMWLSLLSFGRFVRLDKQLRITHQIRVDGHATACTLGGSDGKTLYLVVNKAPDGESLFTAMVGKRTQCTIRTANVAIGRGTAKP